MPAKTKRPGWKKKLRQTRRQQRQKWIDKPIEEKQQDAIRYAKKFGLYPWEVAPFLYKAEDWGFKSKERRDIVTIDGLNVEIRSINDNFSQSKKPSRSDSL